VSPLETGEAGSPREVMLRLTAEIGEKIAEALSKPRLQSISN
jgi:hypothetical protein